MVIEATSSGGWVCYVNFIQNENYNRAPENASDFVNKKDKNGLLVLTHIATYQIRALKAQLTRTGVGSFRFHFAIPQSGLLIQSNGRTC